jgi:hypothetical protein
MFEAPPTKLVSDPSDFPLGLRFTSSTRYTLALELLHRYCRSLFGHSL